MNFYYGTLELVWGAFIPDTSFTMGILCKLHNLLIIAIRCSDSQWHLPSVHSWLKCCTTMTENTFTVSDGRIMESCHFSVHLCVSLNAKLVSLQFPYVFKKFSQKMFKLKFTKVHCWPKNLEFSNRVCSLASVSLSLKQPVIQKSDIQNLISANPYWK